MINYSPSATYQKMTVTSFESQSQPMARTQLPLRLAWAVTVHKSQGPTLPRIRLGLGSWNEGGQRAPAGLFLRSPFMFILRVRSPEVLTMTYQKMRSQWRQPFALTTARARSPTSTRGGQPNKAE
jgi:hypothetical protein